MWWTVSRYKSIKCEFSTREVGDEIIGRMILCRSLMSQCIREPTVLTVGHSGVLILWILCKPQNVEISVSFGIRCTWTSCGIDNCGRSCLSCCFTCLMGLQLMTLYVFPLEGCWSLPSSSLYLGWDCHSPNLLVICRCSCSLRVFSGQVIIVSWYWILDIGGHAFFKMWAVSYHISQSIMDLRWVGCL